MKIRSNIRAGYDRCGGTTRCGGSTRCGGTGGSGGGTDGPKYNLDEPI
jgi:hypothetical protein